MASRLRCAVYTRKSTEEGLDQAFNSLQAQREACEAYITSQVGEGWVLLKEPYDDGGYSGGSIERPALGRLLADIAAGRVDVVVVYKVDRLTRSLADFAKIVEAFDARGVSFVSVTQAFNTTSSMGRLTLNVLLSFAQFEREVTGERIRDKIAASKAKGMWMGGCLPLGYDAPTDPTTRALVVNEVEAEVVRLIFRRYLELGSVHDLMRWLDEEGVRSKQWVSKKGTTRGGVRLGRGALFHLLKNRTYIGDIPHRDRSYAGAHLSIVDPEIFVAVQHQIGEQTRRHVERPLRRTELRLVGKLFDAEGAPMSPTFTRRPSGRVYSYYVSTCLQTGRGGLAPDIIRRVPAGVIERVVKDTLAAATRAEPDLDLVERVDLHANSVHLVADLRRLLGRPIDLGDGVHEIQGRLAPNVRVLADADGPGRVRFINPVRLSFRRGKIEIADALGRPVDPGRNADHTLIRALRSSHEMLARLGEAQVGRPEAAVIKSSPTNPYQRKMLRLAFLAPDLQAQILEGRQSAKLNLQAILAAEFPIAWADQRARFAAQR